MTYLIRQATESDIPVLNDLIRQSVETNCRGDYSPAEIESGLRYIFGVDSGLVRDGTYYVVEDNGIIMACGGWSSRKHLFGGDQLGEDEARSGRLDPETDAAKIRAFFVHPGYTRRGLGKKLLAYAEEQARSAGFSRTEMMATLTGMKLYQVCGYQASEAYPHQMPDGQVFPFVRMYKNIPQLKDTPPPAEKPSLLQRFSLLNTDSQDIHETKENSPLNGDHPKTFSYRLA